MQSALSLWCFCARPMFELLMQIQRCVSLPKVVINVFIVLLVFFIYDEEKLLSELPCFQTWIELYAVCSLYLFRVAKAILLHSRCSFSIYFAFLSLSHLILDVSLLCVGLRDFHLYLYTLHWIKFQNRSRGISRYLTYWMS